MFALILVILINDHSRDNSLNVILEIQKEDPRIKIINNEKNLGILYSRSKAVLEAKGKYILNLDNDDFFLDEVEEENGLNRLRRSRRGRFRYCIFYGSLN